MFNVASLWTLSTSYLSALKVLGLVEQTVVSMDQDWLMVPFTLHWKFPEPFRLGSEDVVDMSVLLFFLQLNCGEKYSNITTVCPPCFLGGTAGTLGCCRIHFQTKTRQGAKKKKNNKGGQFQAWSPILCDFK